jgi:hypothetical protein
MTQKHLRDAPVAYDYVGQIMAYEQGDLDNEDTLTLFRYLVDRGTIWHLQGHYQRAAHAMGLI